MNNIREKLIGLIASAKVQTLSFLPPRPISEDYTPYFIETIADHLIANGATVQEWIPVSERLPENEEDVIVLAQRKHWCKDRTYPITTMGFYTDGKHNTEDSCYLWDDLNEYIEEFDAYRIPEGWWERVVYGEEFSAIDDHVTHWMPLPEPPKGE